MMGAATIDSTSSYSGIDSNPGDDAENCVSSSTTRRIPDWSSTSNLNARAQEIDASSSATRRLPNWTSTSSLTARGQGNRGKYQKVSLRKRVNHTDTDFQSTSSTGLHGSVTQSHSAVQFDRRVLRSSIHPSVSQTEPNNSQCIDHIRQINEGGRFYSPAGTSLINKKDNREEYTTGGIHNDVKLLDKSGSRVLPSWMFPSRISSGSNFSSAGLHDPFRASDENMAGPSDVKMLDKSGGRILPSWMCPSRNSSGRNASSADLYDPFRAGHEKMAGPDESSVFQAVMQDLNQPKQEADLPDGLLSVPLLRHQKIALAWMCQKEARPFCVGGILADDQGLGKTVSIISLILMHKHPQQKSNSEDQQIHKTEALSIDDHHDIGNINSNVDLTEESEGIKAPSKASSTQKQRAAAGTLIVCPATVLRQWFRELNDKVTEEAKLEVLMYHGSSRTKDPSELAKYDVVLTTYAIVANEVPKQPLVDEDDGEQKSEEESGLPTEISLDQDQRKHSYSSKKKRKKGRKAINSCFSDLDSGALARVSWLRVVLDEAQTIKNHRTQVARACWALRGTRRWCLSGTPIQNTIDELFSYFKFLKHDPYSSYRAFCEGIKGPVSRDSQYGYQKLQAVLRTVMLRRTKGTLIDGEPVISLPPKFIQVKSVNFTLEERKFYAKLEAESHSQFKAYALAGTVRQNYANILLMLLRLRQACDHPHLARGFGSDSVRKMSSMKTLRELPKDMLMNLLNCLNGSRICQLCADPPEDAVVAMCGHIFCNQCLLDHLNGDDLTCPARRCEEQLGNDIVFSEVTLRSCLAVSPDDTELSEGDQCDGSWSILSSEYCSSKINAALEILQSLGKSSNSCVNLDSTTDCIGDSSVCVRTQTTHSASSERPKKAIVFSQWTRMLDLMETSLQRSNFHYRRLDGSMTLAARDTAVREFSSDPEVTVMLMSLKAGNLGLNMVAACHVVLLDLWWNPTTEDQAVDRAHRIGQTHPVTVSRLTIKDTVEDRILALQEQKRKMVASAFGEENGDISASRLNLDDLKFLFTGV